LIVYRVVFYLVSHAVLSYDHKIEIKAYLLTYMHKTTTATLEEPVKNSCSQQSQLA